MNETEIWQRIYQALDDGDYETMIALLRPLAEKGNAEAQFRLGCRYDNGEGVKQDYAKAFAWYEKSTLQNHARAQYNLGWLYEAGKGIAQDYGKAFAWYEKSALQGNMYAQGNLANCYEYGNGVVQNYEKAFAWYEKAALQGSMRGQNSLGILYETGKGVSRNYAKAIEWYEKAAMQGDMYAQYNLANLYRDGTGVTQDYEKAFTWYEKSAQQGHAWAECNLGWLYEYGKGRPQDYEQALTWYEKAAAQNNTRAQYYLGVMYEKGLGVAADESRARQWLEKAAMQGNAEAARRLARFYEDGGAIFADGLRLAGSTPRYLGIPPQMLPRVAAVFPALQAEKNALWQQAFAAHQAGDRLTAFALIRELAEDGDADAHYLLALMYLDGTPIVSDHYPAREALYEVKNERAFAARGHLAQIRYWTEKAHDPLRLMESGSCTRGILKKLAAEGDAPAQNFLGCIDAIYGQKATECFADAAAQNDAMGQFNLALAYESGEDDHCDWAQAHDYYEKAAAQDFAPAQFRLALQYLHGKGVARDEALAWRWMARAAAAGDADAQNALGLRALRDGNAAQAQQWFAQAAAQGLAAAQNNLAVCDPAAAQCEGLTQAAAQGEPRAWFNLGVLAERAGNVAQARQHYAQAALCGDLPAQQAYRQLAAGVAANTPSAAMQQALADWAAGDCRRARAAVQTAAEAGDVWAQFCLACIYDDNRIFLRDEAQAQTWLAQAAAGGNIRAQYRLGIRYCDEARQLYQYHVKAKVCDSARLWLVQAAIQGDGAAQRALGEMFTNRDYGVPDRVLADYWRDAAQWANAPADPPGAVQRDSTVAAVDSRQITAYWSAARQGDAAAQYALGVLYQAGEVVPQGFAQAFQWYERAAQQHYAPAQLALGILFEYGKGVAANAARAVQYYEQAALQGHPVAQYRLALHYRDGEGVAQDTAKAREWLARAAEQDNPAAARTLAALSA